MVKLKRQIKAILFDFDGTLVDSEPLHFQMWQQLLVKYGVELTEQQYKDHYAGVPTILNAVDMISRFKLAIPAQSLAIAKKELTRSIIAKSGFPLMPDVREILAQFACYDVKLGIVTGAAKSNVNATIKAHSLEKYFSVIISGEDVSNNKPAPDCYLLAMNQLGVRATDCLAFEDTELGLAAASSAGITCLAIPTALSSHHDFSNAVSVFSSLRQAADWAINYMAADN